MPPGLVKLLQADGKLQSSNQINKDGTVKRVMVCPNMADGIISVISKLLEQDETIAYAYLCSPAVKHVSKLKQEGNVIT
jgi:hypothetical protein